MKKSKVVARKWIIAIPVWGDDYIATLLDITLPMFLSPGNLPWLASQADTILAFVTPDLHRDRIETSSVVEKIRSVCTVQFHVIDVQRHKYDAFARAHQIVFDTWGDPTDVFCMLIADIGLADGYLRSLFKRIQEGWDVVLTTGPRTSLAAMRVALAQHRDPNGSISVTPRDLVGLTLRYLHPSIRAQKWGAKSTPRAFASQHAWGDFADWLYLKSFHLHPVAMTNIKQPVRLEKTIDGGGLEAIYGPSGKFYIAEDSDEGYWCEFSGEEVGNVRAQFEDEAQRIDATALWCALHPDPTMFQYAAHGLLIHTGHAAEAAISEGRADAERVIDLIKSRVPTALARLDQQRCAGGERIIAALEAGQSVGLWGLGSDFNKLRGVCPALDDALRRYPVHLYDRERAGGELFGRTIMAPEDLTFSGQLYPLPSHPDVHWTMINLAPKAFPRAQLVDLYRSQHGEAGSRGMTP